MTAFADLSDGPLPEHRFRPSVNPLRSLRQLWRSRPTVLALAERDLRARYKQTFLGVAWALVTPLLLMVVFTVFFRRAVGIESGDVPYALFSYVGLLPWTFFSSAVSVGALSLVNNMSLLNKVYCPREVFPLAGVIQAAADTAVATVALGVLFVATGFAPKMAALPWVPVLAAVQLSFVVAVALTLSVLTVYLRDLRQAVPILLQLGLFATPVAYGIETIPHGLRGVYSFLNPLAPVIDGYRRALFEGQAPQGDLLASGVAGTALFLAVAYPLFKRLEMGIADVA